MSTQENGFGQAASVAPRGIDGRVGPRARFGTASVGGALVWLLLSPMLMLSDDPTPPKKIAAAERPLDLQFDTATFGGKQFWTDEFVYLDWRIQRNVLTNQYRLLDDKNVRRASGEYGPCYEEFLRRKEAAGLRPLGPRVVIALHGLVRSRESMEGLCQYLRENSDYTVLNVSYASSREKLADHSVALARVVRRLEGVQEVSFVAHSLGNLVIRHYLGDRQASDRAVQPGPHLGRIVMLAPPNNGADLALRFRDNALFRTVWGETGRELGENWAHLQPKLAVPACQFGIIAGGKGDDAGRNPLLAGDDDFVVSVEETKLAGAHDFIVVPAVHGTIMNDAQVKERTLRFLQHGYFVSEQARQPIPGDPLAAPHE